MYMLKLCGSVGWIGSNGGGGGGGSINMNKISDFTE